MGDEALESIVELCARPSRFFVESRSRKRGSFDQADAKNQPIITLLMLTLEAFLNFDVNIQVEGLQSTSVEEWTKIKSVIIQIQHDRPEKDQRAFGWNCRTGIFKIPYQGHKRLGSTYKIKSSKCSSKNVYAEPRCCRTTRC